ncbi:MAG TPA: hypothetical protein ENJ44_03840, partial [Oceanospirillales bacterium]|nr:hypothetical protein [Oceanospirillales bacterium]
MANHSFNKNPLSFFALFILTFISLSQAQAQNRQYEIYFDTDNNQTSGCQIDHAGLPSIYGIDSKITITTDSQNNPIITASNWQKCSGSSFVPQDSVTSALGFDTSASNEDVFEAKINKTLLAGFSATNARVYFATTTTDAEDVVLSTINIDLSHSVQIIPVIGLFGLLLLLLLILLIARKKLPKLQSVMLYLLLISPIVWALSIIIDGQTDDWASLTPVAIDPIGDTSHVGKYADITNVYAKTDDDKLYLRMDIVDVQTQSQNIAPSAQDQAASLVENNTITLNLQGDDADTATIDFIIVQQPAFGQLSSLTRVDGHTMSIDYTPNQNYHGMDEFDFKTYDGTSYSSNAKVTLTITAINTAPSFIIGSNQTVLEDSPQHIINQWASQISAGSGAESGQNLNFVISNNSNPALFSEQPSVDAQTGDLTFTSAADANGTAEITLYLQDDAGTANGGDDTSESQSFSITVTPVNDAPSFDLAGNVELFENAAPFSQ